MMKVSKLVSRGIDEYMGGNFKGALPLYKKALKLPMSNDDMALVHYNIGLCYFSLYDYNEAKKWLKKSQDLGYRQAGWELSMSKLHLGDIGGLNQFHFRYWGRDIFPDLPTKKISKLEDLDTSKKILVLNEQGFGDEILFSRSISLLKNKEFSYQVYPETFPLFRKNINDVDFFVNRSLSYDFVNGYDSWIPTGDLFKIYTLNRGFEPLWFHRKRGKIGRVGVCFKTNKLSKNTEDRSIEYDTLREILLKFKFEWVSLQKDFNIEFAENIEIENFLDTSDIIDGLDFVITVDTVIAHLAAVKGKKVILIWKEYIDWRWNFPFYGDFIELVNIKDLEERLKNI